MMGTETLVQGSIYKNKAFRVVYLQAALTLFTGYIFTEGFFSSSSFLLPIGMGKWWSYRRP